MLFRQGRWTLDGSSKEIWLRLSAGGVSARVKAIFDTGAECCVFPSHITDILFPDARGGKVVQVAGVGGSVDAVAHYVSMDFLSDNERETLLSLPKVRAYFVIQEDYDLSLLGVTGCLDQFNWRLDYKAGELSAQ